MADDSKHPKTNSEPGSSSSSEDEQATGPHSGLVLPAKKAETPVEQGDGYVVLAPYLYNFSRGSIVYDSQLGKTEASEGNKDGVGASAAYEGKGPALVKAGALKRLTKDELKNGVDLATLPEYKPAEKKPGK